MPMGDSAGKEVFAEKGIVECHKAISSVMLRSVILQELAAVLSLGEIEPAGAELPGQLRKWQLDLCQLPGIPGWEQREFTVVAFMSLYMIQAW